MSDPLLIGVLSDMAASPPAEGAPTGIERFVRMAVDPLVASGRIDREVEFVPAYGMGLPSGTAFAVERAFAELDAKGVLAVLGPAIGDNALVATPLSDRYRIPTINWAGTERARSDWMFHLQVGSHEDESIILARHLARTGLRRVGVIYDRSPIGRRYFSFLQSECEVLGILIAAALPVAPVLENAEAEAAVLKDASVDAVVYLGLGLAASAVAAAVSSSGFDGPKMMNTAGLRGYSPDFARPHRRLDIRRHGFRREPGPRRAAPTDGCG